MPVPSFCRRVTSPSLQVLPGRPRCCHRGPFARRRRRTSAVRPPQPLGRRGPSDGTPGYRPGCRSFVAAPDPRRVRLSPTRAGGRSGVEWGSGTPPRRQHSGSRWETWLAAISNGLPLRTVRTRRSRDVKRTTAESWRRAPRTSASRVRGPAGDPGSARIRLQTGRALHPRKLRYRRLAASPNERRKSPAASSTRTAGDTSVVASGRCLAGPCSVRHHDRPAAQVIRRQSSVGLDAVVE